MFTETFTKQYPIALQMIGLHIQEHDLPCPTGIEVDDHPREQIEVRLGWNPDALDAWLDTVVVDDEHNVLREPRDGILEPYFSTRFDVRLPNTGLRFVLVALRDLPVRPVRDHYFGSKAVS